MENLNFVHKFDNNKDPRNFVYDAINNNKTVNQPEMNIPKNKLNKASLPTTVLNTPACGVLNQGNLGSCGPNSLAIASSICSAGKLNDLCRLYTYFNTQCLDNDNPLEDNGVTTQNLVKSLQKYSCCPEKYLPYVTQNYLTLPPLNCYQNTYTLSNVTYSYIQQNSSMLQNLQNNLLNTNNKSQITGVVVGINVYSSFPMNSKNGIIPIPNANKEQLLGGHCVAIVGYTVINNTNYIIFQNSWGTSWGNKGLGYLPIAYLQNPNLSECPTVISFTFVK